MVIKIAHDHPTLLLKHKIQQISDHFLKQHGFNYFQYLRCFNDGSFSLLTNDTRLLELIPTIRGGPAIFSSYTQEHEKLHSYWFLWEEELSSFPRQLAKEHNLYHGITLVRRAKNYYDMIAFALPEIRRNITSFYLTKYKAIEAFINTFEKNHQDVIQHISQHPFILPPSSRDTHYQKICLHNGQVEVMSPHGCIHLTTQELACLRLLLQGATYKQIAKMLTLSPRTVETYIMRVKQRSGIISRADLHQLISVCT